MRMADQRLAVLPAAKDLRPNPFLELLPRKTGRARVCRDRGGGVVLKIAKRSPILFKLPNHQESAVAAEVVARCGRRIGKIRALARWVKSKGRQQIVRIALIGDCGGRGQVAEIVGITKNKLAGRNNLV